MAQNKKKSSLIASGIVTHNRRANFDYAIEEKMTAGLVLTGTEVKSLRMGHANINDAYGVVRDGEIYMLNMFIAEYTNKGYSSHIEKRERKLLLNHREIINITNALARKGATLVAIKLFFNEKGRAKLEIVLGYGKKNYDKRETIKKREIDRKIRAQDFR